MLQDPGGNNDWFELFDIFCGLILEALHYLLFLFTLLMVLLDAFVPVTFCWFLVNVLYICVRVVCLLNPVKKLSCFMFFVPVAKSAGMDANISDRNKIPG